MNDKARDECKEPFYDSVRETIITLLSLVFLNAVSYVVIRQYKRKRESEELYTDEEGTMTYRISLWMCVFTLSISMGAVVLLPVSIVTEEILSPYMHNDYINWLNPVLIQSLWNQVFVCSNLCLFLLMPFAYFLTEAEGFSGWRKGIMSRVCETFVILLLLAICMAVLTQLGISFWSRQSPFTLLEHWSLYFEFLYSLISVVGVLLTLMCTPIGLTKMFSIVNNLLAKPQFLRDLDSEVHGISLEIDNVRKRLEGVGGVGSNSSDDVAELTARAEQLEYRKNDIYRQLSASRWQKNVFYPLTMLFVLLLMGVTMFMVFVNVLRLIVVEGSLPVVATDVLLDQPQPTTVIGRVMSFVEVAVTLYLVAASLTGFYSAPLSTGLQPVLHRTSILKIIANCVAVLMLSSAMPVVTRMLGLTRFDLVGYFGSFAWLGDLRVVLLYNLLFEIAMAVTLTQTVTKSIVNDLREAWTKVVVSKA
ncbi:limb region 1 protein-like [Corticium candelabrum]|uniref:limb region 1 protein-like n=1 Tax=Corticium candelabrum TaxID=121492 RepID=UPI002E254BE7|nr:limb region 1 protein-like [Corticium candelabrum]